MYTDTTITSTTLNRLSATPSSTPWATPTACPDTLSMSSELTFCCTLSPSWRTFICDRPWSSSHCCRSSSLISAGVSVWPGAVLNSFSTTVLADCTWVAITVPARTPRATNVTANVR